ncbi:MAG: O-antigen ligase [Bacilli bacterium]|nr:O-antigen ligase [Bacilli bacterium]
MVNYIIFLLTTILSAFTLMSDNLQEISEVSLFVLSIIIALDYFKNKSLTFFQTWIISFIFIILSEAILINPGENILNAVKFLLLANNIVIIGYLFPAKFKVRKKISKSLLGKSPKYIPYILVFLVLIYALSSLPRAFVTFNMGRDYAAEVFNKEYNVILNSFISSLGFVLPSIIAFYYKEIKLKKSIIIPLILSLPIFAILFIEGTRFPLLFSFGGFLIVSQASYSGKISLNIKLVSLLFLLVISSWLMGQFRSGGLKGFEYKQAESLTDIRLSKRLASMMSPEGVVDMTAMSMTYFESNPHTHGKSIAFLTYFWVPRTVWPDKPTMLGHWMIRKYRSGFGEGHSSSFGFTGELFADFGYFSLFFVFLLGVLLKRVDMYRAFQLAQPMSYSKILVAMMFSYVFFFVRSPVTSSINFIGILLVYSLIRRLLFKKLDTKTVIKNSFN